MKNNRMLCYLNARGIKDKKYKDFCLSGASIDKEFVVCLVGSFCFKVSHFFDDSNKNGFGLIPTNETLQTNYGNILAIGLIEGDDVICMNNKTGEIELWMIQTGEGEYIKVSDSFERFLNMVTSH